VAILGKMGGGVVTLIELEWDSGNLRRDGNGVVIT
jgi:hypothetical protein